MQVELGILSISFNRNVPIGCTVLLNKHSLCSLHRLGLGEADGVGLIQKIMLF